MTSSATTSRYLYRLLLPLTVLVACAPGAWLSDRATQETATVEASETERAGPAAPLELSVVTYNTHGLKARFAKDDPERRFPEIGRLLNDYDVALLQEDFAYHEIIAESARHPIRRRGNGQDRNLFADLLARIVCGECGAGLSTLVGFDESALLREHREAYDAYHGWFEGRYDAWVTKGFLVVRVRLPNGSILDVYNTHLDAGKKRKRTKDLKARREQMAQLQTTIERFSEGNAVIVGGDFNTRVDRPRPRLDEFTSALRLREAAADTAIGWKPRSVYIFYRGAEDVSIQLRESGEGREFVDGDGNQLSDHPPIFARFVIEPLS